VSRPDVAGEYDSWRVPSTAPTSSRTSGAGGSRLTGRLVVETVLLTGVLALLAAIAWQWLAPEVYAEASESGFRVSIFEARREFGIEAWFAIVTGVAGVLAGVILMLRHRVEAVAVQVALAISGVLGAVLTWQVGRAIGPGAVADQARAAESGDLLEMPLDLVSYALCVVWPIAAVIAGAAVVAMRHRDGPPVN